MGLLSLLHVVCSLGARVSVPITPPSNVLNLISYEVISVPKDAASGSRVAPAAVFTYQNISGTDKIACTYVAPFKSDGNYSTVVVPPCGPCSPATTHNNVSHRGDTGCCPLHSDFSNVAAEAKTGGVFRYNYAGATTLQAANAKQLYVLTAIVDRSDVKDYTGTYKPRLCGIATQLNYSSNTLQAGGAQASWSTQITSPTDSRLCENGDGTSRCISTSWYHTAHAESCTNLHDYSHAGNEGQFNCRNGMTASCCDSGEHNKDCSKRFHCVGSHLPLRTLGELDVNGPVAALAFGIESVNHEVRMSTLIAITQTSSPPIRLQQSTRPGFFRWKILKDSNNAAEVRIAFGTHITQTGRQSAQAYDAPMYSVFTYVKKCIDLSTNNDCSTTLYFASADNTERTYDWQCNNDIITQKNPSDKPTGSFPNNYTDAVLAATALGLDHQITPSELTPLNKQHVHCNNLTSFTLVKATGQNWYSLAPDSPDELAHPMGMVSMKGNSNYVGDSTWFVSVEGTKLDNGLVIPSLVPVRQNIPTAAIVTRDTDNDKWDTFNSNDNMQYTHLYFLRTSTGISKIATPKDTDFVTTIYTDHPYHAQNAFNDDLSGAWYSAFTGSGTLDASTLAFTYVSSNVSGILEKKAVHIIPSSTTTTAATTTTTKPPDCPDGEYRSPYYTPQQCVPCPDNTFRRKPHFGTDTACQARTNCISQKLLPVWGGNATSDAICALYPQNKSTCPGGTWMDGQLNIVNHTYTLQCFENDATCPWAPNVSDISGNYTHTLLNNGSATAQELANIQAIAEYYYNRTGNTNKTSPLLVPLCADVKNCSIPLFESTPPTPTSDRICSYCGCVESNAAAPPASDFGKCNYTEGVPTRTGSAYDNSKGLQGTYNHIQCLVPPYDNAPLCCPFQYDHGHQYESNVPGECLTYGTPAGSVVSTNAQQETCTSMTLSLVSISTPTPTTPTTITTTAQPSVDKCDWGTFVNTTASPHVCSVCPDGQYNNENGSSVTSCYPIVQCKPTEISIYGNASVITKQHGNICGTNDNVCPEGQYTIGYGTGNNTMAEAGHWGIRQEDLPSGINITNLSDYTIIRDQNGWKPGTSQLAKNQGVRYVRLCQSWKNCSAEKNEYQVTAPTETSNRVCDACPVINISTTNYTGVNQSCNRRRNATGSYTNRANNPECTGVNDDNQPFCCRRGYDRSRYRYTIEDSATCTQEQWLNVLVSTTTVSTLTSVTSVTSSTGTTTTTTTPFKVLHASSISSKEERGLGYSFFGTAVLIICIISVFKIRAMVRDDASYKKRVQKKRRQ